MNLNLLVIRTKQLHELAKFYENLGLVFQYHKHGNGAFHYSAKIENLVFEIYPLKKNQTEFGDYIRLGFDVENVDSLFEKLSANGVRILKDPQQTEWGYWGIIQDLDGRKIEIKQS